MTDPSENTAHPADTGVTVDLYKAAIGPRGQDYYLRHFLKFDEEGKTSASWHWPACGATLNWLVFRKMWGQALGYGAAMVVLGLLVFGVGKLVFDYADTGGLLLLLLFLSAAFVLPGLYANALYYTHCSKKITAALQEAANFKQACDLLAGQACTPKRWRGMVVANAALLVLLAAGALALNLGQASLFRAHSDAGPLTAGQPKPDEPPAVTWAGVVRAEAQSPAAPASLPGAPEVPMKPASASAGMLASVAEPVAAMAAVKTSEPEMAKRESPVAAQPPSPPEPLQVAAPVADQPASAVKRAKRTVVASGAGAQVKPVRPDLSVSAAPPAQAASSKARHQWFVQVGAFGKEANAQSARARVEATGLTATTESSDTSAGRLIRVRAGPFASKGEAERAALQIKAQNLPAVLVRQ